MPVFDTTSPGRRGMEEPLTVIVEAASVVDIDEIPGPPGMDMTENQIDGVGAYTLPDGPGKLFLLKDQTTQEENGVYRVGLDGKLCDRYTPVDQSAELERGVIVMVKGGTVNAGKCFSLTNEAPIVVGTDHLTFAEVTDRAAVVDDKTLKVGIGTAFSSTPPVAKSV